MSDARRETFEVGGRTRIELNLPSGEAVFVPGEQGKVEVQVEGYHAEVFLIEQVGGRIVLRTPGRLSSRWDSFDVSVRMPEGADLEVKAASADVGVELALGSLSADLASGDLRAQKIEGSATVETASGDVELGEVGGRLEVGTASGDVRLGEGRNRTAVSTASGEARLGSVLGALVVTTQSGGIEVEHYAGDDLECNSTSGDVRVGLPPGRDLDVDLNTVSGEIRSDFSPEGGDGATARLNVKTISGDISLVRAAGR
ncbi:MAG: DUF4097 family beta strand repeat-containing protein [Rubrobacter sp.]